LVLYLVAFFLEILVPVAAAGAVSPPFLHHPSFPLAAFLHHLFLCHPDHQSDLCHSSFFHS
jgi:hypothetical protein